ncbi:MAG: hypothetical protein Q7R31_00355 [Candidatus Levybacteria bacterium]|nr:hypothetical protein [Candidatus Levybacteria bacterium]
MGKDTAPVVDDFKAYSDWVKLPEGASNEKLTNWFDQIFVQWRRDPGDFTSSGLLKAMKELGQKDWTFTLTLFKGQNRNDVPDGIETVAREAYKGSNAYHHDISARAIGFANADSQLFLGVSQDHLTLSRRRAGLIKAFKADEVIGLRAVAPKKDASKIG